MIGDRPREAPGSPRPFASMPIVYERAFGGPAVEDNPVGTGAVPGSALPNVVDPQNPHRPAGFGPIARHWGPRRRLLAGIDPHSRWSRRRRRDPERPRLGVLPRGAGGQQIPALCGDEWIVVDGVCTRRCRTSSRASPPFTPTRAWCLVGATGPGPSRALELRADTLVITPETQLCSLCSGAATSCSIKPTRCRACR